MTVLGRIVIVTRSRNMNEVTKIVTPKVCTLPSKADQYAALAATYSAQLTGQLPKTNPTHPVWR